MGKKSKARLEKKRTCSKCKKEKPLFEFPRDASQPGGFRYACGDCHAARLRDQRARRRRKNDEVEAQDNPANVAFLRNVVASLERKLVRAESHTDVLLQAAREILQPLALIPGVKPYTPPKHSTRVLPETQVALVSDLQVGKVTKTYNTAVFAERMTLYFERILRLAELQRAHHPVHDLVVLLDGDLVEGEGIFPGQTWEIQSGALEQAARGAQVLALEIAKIAPHYRKIYALVVGGNHGRTGKDWNPKSNFDLVMGELMKHQLSGIANVDVEVCYEWCKVIKVQNTGFMVTHGDKIRSGGDTPFTAIAKRVGRWRESVPGGWSVLVLGHFHNYANFLWNGVEVFVNGSPESSNEFAQSYMGMASEPLQVVMFVHPKRGISGRYPIYLSREKEAA